MHTVAIVGGETHIEEVTSLVGSRVQITGAAVRPEQTAWARERFEAPVYANFEQMLAEVPCEIVVLANENDEKADVALYCLRSGKHLIVDKPMALRLHEVERIEALASEKQLRVLMLLTLRGNPWYRKVRELIGAGTIGVPVQAYGKMSVELARERRPAWFLDKERAGGPILDLAIHTVDQIEWVTGLWLTRVTAYETNISDPRRQELVDSGAMFFRLSNGGTAVIEQNRLMPAGTGSDYRLNVVGTEGQVNLSFGRGISVISSAGERRIAGADLQPPVSVVADWLASLAGGDALVPDWASFRANKIACLAKNAADTGTTVEIPRLGSR